MIVVDSNLEAIAWIKEMTLIELQNTVLRLAANNEHVRSAFQQAWREREREARLRASVQWSPADWLEATQHFDPIIKDELEQCVASYPGFDGSRLEQKRVLPRVD